MSEVKNYSQLFEDGFVQIIKMNKMLKWLKTINTFIYHKKVNKFPFLFFIYFHNYWRY